MSRSPVANATANYVEHFYVTSIVGVVKTFLLKFTVIVFFNCTENRFKVCMYMSLFYFEIQSIQLYLI